LLTAALMKKPKKMYLCSHVVRIQVEKHYRGCYQAKPNTKVDCLIFFGFVRKLRNAEFFSASGKKMLLLTFCGFARCGTQ